MCSSPSSLPPLVDVFAKKKYKPVAQKIRPVLGTLPDKFRIERHIYGDPLADMPKLNPNPPPFEPTGRYTTERRDTVDLAHPGPRGSRVVSPPAEHESDVDMDSGSPARQGSHEPDQRATPAIDESDKEEDEDPDERAAHEVRESSDSSEDDGGDVPIASD
ncbi:hypothetical protein C8R46DRAFT_1233914 [Mycena filopes]|nr:hypothetical protein C8R46DRAFT_1233914 [Mycena filopes]